MKDISWYLTTSRAVIAAVFAAGLAATPVAMNSAAAQTDDANTPGRGVGEADPGASDDGAAEEFVDPIDPTSDVGGNLEPGMSSGEIYDIDVAEEKFTDYREAAERGDAEQAGQALAEASGEQEITTEYVIFVNDELGVVTVLTPEQIAEAAN